MTSGRSGSRASAWPTSPRTRFLGAWHERWPACYDLQWDPSLRHELTYSSPSTGDAVSLAFIQPRSVDELVRRRRMFELWADCSGGMLGRTPDYLNAILAGCASSSWYFARNGPEYAERIVPTTSGAASTTSAPRTPSCDPQTNRARTQTEQADPTVPLHIVGESAEGLVVSGARMLATLAPFSDELMVFPSPSRRSPTDAAALRLRVRDPRRHARGCASSAARASTSAARLSTIPSPPASRRWTPSRSSTRSWCRGSVSS